MTVTMAIGTGCELQACFRSSWSVALVAGNSLVTPLEWITGLSMIESRLLGYLPTGRIMAALATQSEAPTVRILVAVAAIFVADIGESQILTVDRRSSIFGLLMALHACSSAVTSR